MSELRTMGRATQGVRLITLKENDEIASVARIEHDEAEVETGENAGNPENPATDSPEGEKTEE